MATTHYLWNDITDTVAMEKDGAGNTTAVYASDPVPFGRLRSMRRGGTTYNYHFDGRGNATCLTDQTGKKTDAYTYDAFGTPRTATGNTENPYRFGGQHGYQYNPATGDYDVRARVYQPKRGRWRSEDPLRFADSMNHYAYGANGPLSAVDAVGLLALPLSVLPRGSSPSLPSTGVCRRRNKPPRNTALVTALAMKPSPICCTYVRYYCGWGGGNDEETTERTVQCHSTTPIGMTKCCNEHRPSSWKWFWGKWQVWKHRIGPCTLPEVSKKLCKCKKTPRGYIPNQMFKGTRQWSQNCAACAIVCNKGHGAHSSAFCQAACDFCAQGCTKTCNNQLKCILACAKSKRELCYSACSALS